MRAQWSITPAQQDEANQWARKFRAYNRVKDGSWKDRIVGRLGETSVKYWLKSENVRVTEGDEYRHDLLCHTPCGQKRLEIKSKWINGWPGNVLDVNVRLDQLQQQRENTHYYVFTFVHPDENEGLTCTIVGYETPNQIDKWLMVKEGEILRFNNTASRYDMYIRRNSDLQLCNHLLAYLR